MQHASWHPRFRRQVRTGSAFPQYLFERVFLLTLNNAIRSLFAFVALTVSAFAAVTVTSPANNSTVSSPAHFVASATSSKQITGMRIYIDGVDSYHVSSSSLNTNLTMSTGKHNVVVKAWDKSGAATSTALALTVGTTTAPPPPAPTPTPTGSVVTSNIDERTVWGHCDVCAGMNAAGPTATHTLDWTSSPTMDTKSAHFTLAGTTPYSNAIWWNELKPSDSASHFVYDLYFYIKDPASSEALEFDMNQTTGGRRYVYGTQCGVNYDHQWDVWDTANGHWMKTGVACTDVKAFSWNHLVWEFSRSNGQINYVSVTLNGVKSYVNASYSSKAWTNGPELNVAFQMDQAGAAKAYEVWLDQVSVTQW
jgi:Bacterial Ig domain